MDAVVVVQQQHIPSLGKGEAGGCPWKQCQVGVECQSWERAGGRPKSGLG